MALGIVVMATNEEKREVLMMVREAPSNCVRHALETRRTHLRLLIANDEVGFTQENHSAKGYGPSGMGRRTPKGRRLRSNSGKGMRIMVEFALKPGSLPL